MTETDHLRVSNAVLIDAIQSYRSAVDLMNAAMKDGINVHGAVSAMVGAEELCDYAIELASTDPASLDLEN